MFLDRFFAKNRSSSKRANKKNIPSEKKLFNNAAEHKNLFLEVNNKLNSTKKLDQELGKIDKILKEDGSNNQLLLKKADILLRKGKIKQARLILKKLTEKQICKKISKSARQLITLSEHIQGQDSFNKIKTNAEKLHKISKKYGYKLTNIPDVEHIQSDFEFTLAVRKEAWKAIDEDLPMLALELINQILEADQKMPWLVLGKALSLSAMGRRDEAQELLDGLKKSVMGEKINNSIDKALKEIEGKNNRQIKLKTNICLAKHLKSISSNQGFDTLFLPKTQMISHNTNVKSLIFNNALELLSTDPQKTLILVNAILDFNPGDGASMQLKGEALNALKQFEKAIKVWKILTKSNNNKISRKANNSISKLISKRAETISFNRSPEEAVQFFVYQHLKHKLMPKLNKSIDQIISRTKAFTSDPLNTELKKYEHQLYINTLIVDWFENNFAPCATK